MWLDTDSKLLLRIYNQDKIDVYIDSFNYICQQKNNDYNLEAV